MQCCCTKMGKPNKLRFGKWTPIIYLDGKCVLLVYMTSRFINKA